MLNYVQLCRGGQITQLPCQNLVFAAGAWTPGLFRSLFPHSSVKFADTVNSGNWIIVKNPFKLSAHSIGQIILDDVVGHQLEFVGRDDGTIWISGLNNTKTPLVDVGDVVEPDRPAIDKLILPVLLRWSLSRRLWFLLAAVIVRQLTGNFRLLLRSKWVASVLLRNYARAEWAMKQTIHPAVSL